MLRARTAADIMKKAMLSVNDSLKKQKIDAKLIPFKGLR
ncbi:MAG: hypothetical protein Ct9H300mP3_05810 [Gammaproteobacteria bacterium]|nr:MAG: hypothetical protein Ct9H300mP3_05810 [Gammaproteobacteria bacterium]